MAWIAVRKRIHINGILLELFKNSAAVYYIAISDLPDRVAQQRYGMVNESYQKDYSVN